MNGTVSHVRYPEPQNLWYDFSGTMLEGLGGRDKLEVLSKSADSEDLCQIVMLETMRLQDSETYKIDPHTSEINAKIYNFTVSVVLVHISCAVILMYLRS